MHIRSTSSLRRARAAPWLLAVALAGAVTAGPAVTGLEAGPGRAAAQDGPDEDDEGGGRERLPSFELALHGSTLAVLGDALRLEGVAYEVRGLAELAPLGAGGEVVARLTKRDPRTGAQRLVVEQRVAPGTGGRFALALRVPDEALSSPALEVTVGRRGGLSRSWSWSVRTVSSLRVELLTDRVLYEPGETARVWARVLRAGDGAPVPSREVALAVTDARGQRAAERRVRTGPGGVAVLELPLGAAAPEGSWNVSAAVVGDPGGVSAMRSFRVGRRTVERLFATLTLDQQVVPPGAALSGRVAVRTPSGAPVRGARVVVRVAGRDEPITLESDGEGVAAFRTNAPAFLSGDSASMQVTATATHPAHGSIGAAASYTLARVEWLVSAAPAAGGLVPEVDTEMYVSVASPLGQPPPAGTRVTASGAAVRGGQATATTDAAGLVVVPMRLPASAIARLTRGGTGCTGESATAVELVVDAGRPLATRVCVRAAPEAEVVPRVTSPVAAPGGEVAFEVRRRPRAQGRPVLVELLAGGRTVAATWLGGGEARGTVTLPAGVSGVVDVRARAAASENARAADDEPWAVAVGAGATDAVLVRPADAFALAVETPADPVPVRSRARVTLRTTRIATAGSAQASAGGPGFAAVLARDLAAHGGEAPWALAWMQGLLGEAAASPRTADGERALRAALAGGLGPDPVPARPAPLHPRPGDEARYGFEDPEGRGVLRDPVALRGELLRRQLGRVMVTLEQVVAGLRDAEDRREAERGVVVRNGNRVSFDPRAIATLVARGDLDDASTRTLGGARMTVGMLQQADPSFSFDAAARRVARRQLVELLVALAAFTDPDDAAAARAIAGEPPERWLGKMARLGMISDAQLRDPWGRPFAFRRGGGAGSARLVLSDRAPDYELASAGPDGVPGNGDDVRDPFARVVAKGTVYAVACGEDRLMEQLSAIGAGEPVLARMAAAFESLGLEAREEGRQGALRAMASEEAPSEMAMGVGDAEYGEVSVSGSGAAGGGFAGIAAPSRMAARGVAVPAAPPAQEMADGRRDEEAQRGADGRARAGGSSRLQVLGEMIRERFPATLFFAGEAPLDPSGATALDIPVADALTSYVVEAIAWTPSGWTASAAGTLRVDQEASVDAPVPPFAAAGDVLRLPVRVGNRTRAPLEVRVEVSADGGLALEAPGPRAVTVPPLDSTEALFELRLPRESAGSVVVRCVRASDGSALDAIKRPLVVWRDARLERRATESLLDGDTALTLTVPADASPRGDAELRASAGSDLFGDTEAWARESGSLAAGWALAAAGADVPAPARAAADAYLRTREDGAHSPRGSAADTAAAMGVAWGGDTTSDEQLRAALRYLGDALRVGDPTRAADATAGARERIAPPPPPGPSGEGATQTAARVLLGLAPALARADARAAVKADLERFADALRRRVEDGGAASSDRPALSALCAAALAVAGRGRPARVDELLRRAERGLVRVGDTAFLEADDGAPVARTRVGPTALLALARLWRGERAEALPAFKALAGLRGTRARWDEETRALAALVALRISGGRGSAALRLRVDGRPVPLAVTDGTAAAAVPGLGRPGAHRVEVSGTGGVLTLVTLDVRYGRPWEAPLERAAPIALAIEGAIGARDRRSGVRVSVQNRGARVLSSPVVEIDLPAGAELDEPTRARLRERTGEDAALEGRTLRLRLRALPPGAYARLPLPVRWATGGRLRGLGVVAYDAAEPPSLDARAIAVAPSREVIVADEGPETGELPAEASPEPLPPPDVGPPTPRPPPIPLRPRASRAAPTVGAPAAAEVRR
jgi:hypothetical protein